MILQVFDVSVSGNEPEELIDNRLEMNFFRGQKGETLRQVKSHLMAENRLRADPGAVRVLQQEQPEHEDGKTDDGQADLLGCQLFDGVGDVVLLM